MNSPHSAEPIIPRNYLFGFVIVTCLFALWGFANDITNPMVAAFKNILLLSNTESALVQTAFYGGYCVMAIPAAIFITRFTYKTGILMGLALYAVGCLMFIPAGQMQIFVPFLIAYFVMTCGLAFLETSANPYILSMGSDATATRRLNFAQAFNPLGSITGMLVAREFILARLNKMPESGRRELLEADPKAFSSIADNDLSVITTPYVILGLVVASVFVLFLIARLPKTESPRTGSMDLGGTLSRLIRNRFYLYGVAAQTFYVGAQIMCWTFIIQYAEETLIMSKENAQGYNILAMVIFVVSRFICTYLLKYIEPGNLLTYLAIGGAVLILGTIFLPGMTGLWCLVGVSACMSLMFPTIYGIALDGLGDDAKLGSAGLICAIGGGCFLPLIQALIMDHSFEKFSSVRASFLVPLICFIAIIVYGRYVSICRANSSGHRNR